jgi:hypothetical protein
MLNDLYTKELLKIMTNDAPARATSMTRAEIEAAIAEISARLKKPMHNAFRLCLVEERTELRKVMAQIQNEPGR